MAKHTKAGLGTKSFLRGEYDKISVYLTIDQLPENSEDGRALLSLYWFVDEKGYWTTYT